LTSLHPASATLPTRSLPLHAALPISSSNARSMIATSTPLIVTGSSLIPSTHAPSHGAGQRRPVHSGKLTGRLCPAPCEGACVLGDRKSTRLNSSHVAISYAFLCSQKK